MKFRVDLQISITFKSLIFFASAYCDYAIDSGMLMFKSRIQLNFHLLIQSQNLYFPVGRVSSLGWLGLGIKENIVQWTARKFTDKEGLPGRRGWYWFLFRHDTENQKAEKGYLFFMYQTYSAFVWSECNKILTKPFWIASRWISNLSSMKISASTILSVLIIFIRTRDIGSYF